MVENVLNILEHVLWKSFTISIKIHYESRRLSLAEPLGRVNPTEGLKHPPVHFHYRMGVLEPLYKSVFYIKIVSHDDLVCLHVVVI